MIRGVWNDNSDVVIDYMPYDFDIRLSKEQTCSKERVEYISKRRPVNEGME